LKPLLKITDLRVRRSEAFQLNIESLELAGRNILCVAGPNGSGKTTMIECLAGLLRPDAGKMMLAGQAIDNNLKATKRILGYVPDDEAWFVKELCALEYFELLIEVYRSAGIQNDMPVRIHKLAKALYFNNFRQPLEQLSHGNKKKVQLIAGLMHEPRLIVIDELRNGLDPLALVAAEHLLKQEARRGACIVASTHDLWWAERLADEVLLMVDGKPAISGRSKKLIQRYGSLEKLFLNIVNPEAASATV
jgi:ABC-2 type transport system ATP-binding protein